MKPKKKDNESRKDYIIADNTSLCSTRSHGQNADKQRRLIPFSEIRIRSFLICMTLSLFVPGVLFINPIKVFQKFMTKPWDMVIKRSS
jgi:hypothetical protein